MDAPIYIFDIRSCLRENRKNVIEALLSNPNLSLDMYRPTVSPTGPAHPYRPPGPPTCSTRPPVRSPQPVGILEIQEFGNLEIKKFGI